MDLNEERQRQQQQKLAGEMKRVRKAKTEGSEVASSMFVVAVIVVVLGGIAWWLFS